MVFWKSSAKEGGDEDTPKKSLYQRYEDKNNGRDKVISDEDLLKYTGKTREEINAWAKDRPGVAGNQAAGTLAAGPATGFGGMATADGFGGWGTDAGSEPKYPPQQKTTRAEGGSGVESSK
ncbi:hypothetical protein COL26b_008262 [Colletotrichum chrysophilum]|uniref:uncharacterized protein n=1 Tax=Colletotrichum chrysophilum TaxID=1836956 RepID=UPI0022FFDC4E|nr:uncharacterized protein COL26b_008262 [Colletotrichum chrysophilum]KAJ0373541.1 hypothetical protein COL26b_008262 [Colletotrichum chrysophilum]